MTQNLPPKYVGYVIIIVLILAVGTGVVLAVYSSGSGKSMLMSILFMIPGMTKIMTVMGGV